MNIIQILKQHTQDAIKNLYDADFESNKIIINETIKDYEGDMTVVVFPIVKIARQKPEQVGDSIGQYLQEKLDFITGFNTVKGFLNLSFSDAFWLDKLNGIAANPNYGMQPSNDQTVVLEYCGPNTNKPLHLGHIRNMVLGYSVAEILKANGYQVHKVNILNDRGIAICKSMLAWQKFGNGETPKSTQKKGDHFVGNYYVKFNKELNNEYKAWQNTEAANVALQEWLPGKAAQKLAESGKDDASIKSTFFKQYKNEYTNKYSALGQEAREMLVKWEAGDVEVRGLWEQMNNWVYEGFEQTWQRLGIDFEEHYKESEHYEAGKKTVLEELDKGTMYQKDDGSVWIDLEAEKLDHKIMLRKDGTSVYVTQDIGIAEARYNKYKMDKSIYTVGDEQNYHFQVLKATLDKIGRDYAEGIHHLSYGMVDLPTGKMKSREGTVVDADDLIDEVVAKAKQSTEASGKIEDFTSEQATELFEKIGIGAIRFFILQVNPQKRMIFDPAKSVELEGMTSTFVQYSYARIQSLLRKYGKEVPNEIKITQLEPLERELILMVNNFEKTVLTAGKEYDPSVIAQYTYHLAKTFNKFWNELSILKADEATKDFRVLLSNTVAQTIQKALGLLGIKTTDRM